MAILARLNKLGPFFQSWFADVLVGYLIAKSFIFIFMIQQ